MVPQCCAGAVQVELTTVEHCSAALCRCSAVQYSTVQRSTALFCAVLHCSALYRCSTVQYNAMQCCTVRHSAVQCGAVQCCTAQAQVECSTAHQSTVQVWHSAVQQTVQYSALQHSTVQVQYSALQHSTVQVQYSAAQYGTSAAFPLQYSAGAAPHTSTAVQWLSTGLLAHGSQGL